MDDVPEFILLDEAIDSRSVYNHRDFDRCMLKIAFAGQAGAGKSSILARIANRTFSDNQHKPTVGIDFVVKRLWCRNGRRVKLQIYDFAGDERYIGNSFASLLCKADAAIVVFDATDALRSLDVMAKWKTRLDEDMPPDYLCAVACNKIDELTEEQLADDGDVAHWAGQLPKISKFNGGFYCTSAKTGFHCERMVYEIAMRVLDAREARGEKLPSLAPIVQIGGNKSSFVLDENGRPLPNTNRNSRCCGRQ